MTHEDTLPEKKKNWFARNWLWFVPTGCLAIVALAVAAVLGILFMVTGIMNKSDPYQHSLKIASEHPTVIEQLGQPIESGWLASGSINIHNNTGKADITIPISGPKGSAKIRVVAEKAEDEWTYETMTIEFENSGERLDLNKIEAN